MNDDIVEVENPLTPRDRIKVAELLRWAHSNAFNDYGVAVLKMLEPLCAPAPVHVRPVTYNASDYPEPTPQDLVDLEFNAVWEAIKGWDISRDNDGQYSSPTGNDVMHILKALRSTRPPEPDRTVQTVTITCPACRGRCVVGTPGNPCAFCDGKGSITRPVGGGP